MDNVNKRNKGGRKPKSNRSTHRFVFRLTDEENAKLLSLYEASPTKTMAQFIVSVLFQREIKVARIDFPAMDYHLELTRLFAQFRALGVNYNQVVKLLYRNFSEKKAAAYLFRLEKQTTEMAALCQKIVVLTKEFELNYLIKRQQQ